MSVLRLCCSGAPGLYLLRARSACLLWGSRRFQNQQQQYNQQNQQQYNQKNQQRRSRSMLTYVTALVVGMVGTSYAAVPLYRLFCQSTGFGGTVVVGHSSDQVAAMKPVRDRVITITFNADTHSSLNWNFRPQQSEIYLVPGETALAFYKAKNPTDKAVIGISTYNVLPFDAGQYFNKIQCFCFEEQRLNPNEEVDMPVFFFIDPEFAEDPRMAFVDNILLSYTFFEAKGGHSFPLPGRK